MCVQLAVFSFCGNGKKIVNIIVSQDMCNNRCCDAAGDIVFTTKIICVIFFFYYSFVHCKTVLLTDSLTSGTKDP